MLANVKDEDILFLDIETVPEKQTFDELSDDFKQFWEKKSAYFRKENESASDVYQRAGIYAEFGKIICISAGFINTMNGEKKFRVKSFYGEEKELLTAFSQMLEKFTRRSNEVNLCAHNGKEFDFPYIARRMLINGLKLPHILDVAGKKPWEVKFLDTLELWKFGDYKHYTSLSLLTSVFNIPSPKDDIDGSMVADVFYEKNELERIVIYCEKDVLAVVQLYLRFKGEKIFTGDDVESTTEGLE